MPAQGPQGRRPEPGPVRHRGPRHVRLRRHPDRLHPRLRPRPGPGQPHRSSSTAGSTWPAEPELDGKALPTGFGVGGQRRRTSRTRHPGRRSAAGPASQIDAYRIDPAGQPAWERDFLVLEEHLPAGTTLVEGSVQSQASHYDAGRRRPDLLLRPRPVSRARSATTSTATCPGQYRALPAALRDAYEPGRSHLGPAGRARACSRPGETSTDPYKATPDELYARGKALFDAGRLAEAAAPLEALFGGYTLRDDVAKDAARMLLIDPHPGLRPPQGRPVLRGPQGEGPRAGHPLRRDPGRRPGLPRHRRARAGLPRLAGDRRGQLPRRRPGRRGPPPARQDARGDRLPARPLARVPRHGVDRERLLRPLAGPRPASPARPSPTPPLRRELADGRRSPGSDLLLQAIRLIQVFLSPVAQRTRWPTRRAWPWSAPSWSWRTTRRSSKLARAVRQALPQEHVPRQLPVQRGPGPVPPRPVRPGHRGGRGDRRGDLQGRQRRRPAEPEQVAGALHPRPDLRRPPPARRRPSTYYEQVADRFTDAAGAVAALTRKALTLPEVSVVRPAAPPKVAAGAGRPPRRRRRPTRPKAAARPSVELDYRNIAEADVKVYPVDLMRLYLTRRNLDAIAGIDLAGITPAVRDDGQARRRRGLRRQGPGARPAADEGGGLPGDGPRRRPVRLGDRAGHAAGAGGPRGARQPAGSG